MYAAGSAADDDGRSPPRSTGTSSASSGTEEQKQRWVPGIADGSPTWLRHHRNPTQVQLATASPERAGATAADGILSGQKVLIRWTRAQAVGGGPRHSRQDQSPNRSDGTVHGATDTRGSPMDEDRHGGVKPGESQFQYSSKRVRLPSDALVGWVRGSRDRTVVRGPGTGADHGRGQSGGHGPVAINKAVETSRTARCGKTPTGAQSGPSQPVGAAPTLRSSWPSDDAEDASLYDAARSRSGGGSGEQAKYAAGEA